eukprot:UN10675
MKHQLLQFMHFLMIMNHNHHLFINHMLQHMMLKMMMIIYIIQMMLKQNHFYKHMI